MAGQMVSHVAGPDNSCRTAAHLLSCSQAPPAKRHGMAFGNSLKAYSTIATFPFDNILCLCNAVIESATATPPIESNLNQKPCATVPVPIAIRRESGLPASSAHGGRNVS